MFKSIFGINKNQVRETCIVMPVLTKGFLSDFGLENFGKGSFYSSGNGKNFTLVHTHVGAGFVGDCVLYLKDTACQNIILFGSCGLVKETEQLKIGSLVTPVKSYAMESFSDLLSGKTKFKTESADNNLAKHLLSLDPNIKAVTAACVGSIKLEQAYKNFFLKNNIQILDMESSSLFAAAKKTNRKAAALFYATDILGNISSLDKDKISPAIKKGVHYLLKAAAA